MCECEVYHDVEHFLSSDVHNLTDYAFHVVCDKNIFFFLVFMESIHSNRL